MIELAGYPVHVVSADKGDGTTVVSCQLRTSDPTLRFSSQNWTTSCARLLPSEVCLVVDYDYDEEEATPAMDFRIRILIATADEPETYLQNKLIEGYSLTVLPPAIEAASTLQAGLSGYLSRKQVCALSVFL